MDQESGFARSFADGDFSFDWRFGLFDAIGFRADERAQSSLFLSPGDVFYRLETGGGLGTLLGCIQPCGNISNALASLSS